MIVGYARVSTDGQSLEAQHASLADGGAEKVCAEKVSGAVTERRALTRAIAALAPGDVLLVTKLDRLARSTRDLLNTLDAAKSLGDPWADTTTPHGKLMITVLGGLAEFERHLNPRPDQRRARTRKGARSEVRAQAEAHQASKRGGPGAEGSWRGASRDRSELQRQPLNDFEASAGSALAARRST